MTPERLSGASYAIRPTTGSLRMSRTIMVRRKGMVMAPPRRDGMSKWLLLLPIVRW